MSPLAHPLTGSPGLPVPGVALAGVTVLLAAVVVTRLGAAAPEEREEPATEPRWTALTRALAAVVLLALVAVARLGPPEEPRNVASVSATYVLWPALLAAAALLGRVVWRAVDPFRALGSVERLVGGAADAPPADVRPAVVTGAAWAVFAVTYAVSVPPRALGVALALYALVMVAGSVALGRRRWLGSADALGLLVSWTGLRGGLVRWAPPLGAAALLGAVYGGTLAARLRLSSAWGRVALSPDAETWTRLAAFGAVAAGALLAAGAARWAVRRGAPGSVAAALVPVVVATVVATTLRRTMVAAQLAAQLLRITDPRPVDLNPWGTAVQQALAWALVTLGTVAGAVVVARRAKAVRARDPAALALYVAGALAVLAVTVE